MFRRDPNVRLWQNPEANRLIRLTITKLPNEQYLATSVGVLVLVAQGRSESEAARIASRSTGIWAKSPIWDVCSDPSHPPLVQFPGQKGLYRQVLDKVEALTGSSTEDDDVARMVFDEMISVLSQPTDSTEEGHRVQGIRRSVAKEWGSVLCRVENLAYLTSWFMLGRIRDTDKDPLDFVLCLLALEATRTLFATVHQVRGGLADETFGYWRTLYEIFVIGRFLLRFSEEDSSLPGRCSNSTYSRYLDFYKRFGPTGNVEIGEDSWSQIEEFYKSQYPIEGKGNYGWAYPTIARRRPTFRDLAEAVDKKSRLLDRYYAFATSKRTDALSLSSMELERQGARPSVAIRLAPVRSIRCWNSHFLCSGR